MDNSTFESPQQITESSGSFKNIIIIILAFVLVLSLLGINIFTIFGDIVQYITNIINPLFSKGIYASGNIIDKSSDVLADASKTGIDIAHDTVQSVGELLMKSSGKNDSSSKNIDVAINQPHTISQNQPIPDTSTSPIQSSISSSKNQWCLVGEYNGARGCVNIDDQSKCMSGQLFPTQQMCLNPTFTQR